MSVTLRTTRYGLSPRAAGWDQPGDSGTDNWEGSFGNKLTTASCALAVNAEAKLAGSLVANHPALCRDANGQIIPGRLRHLTLLRVTWPGTPLVRYCEFADRAPETDEPGRFDIFLPWKDDPSIPEHGEVTVIN